MGMFSRLRSVVSDDNERNNYIYLSYEGAATLVFLLASQLDEEDRGKLLVKNNRTNFRALQEIISALKNNQGEKMSALFEKDDARQEALAKALQFSMSEKFLMDNNEVNKNTLGFGVILEEDQSRLVMQWMGWKSYDYKNLDEYKKRILDKEIKKVKKRYEIIPPEQVNIVSSVGDQVVSRRPNLFQSIFRRGQNKTVEDNAPSPLQAGNNGSPNAAAESAPAAPSSVSIPTATYQDFERGAHSERFLIHLLGSQLKGGMATVYSQFDVSNPDVLSQITNQLAIEGKDVSNPLSLFGNDVGNAKSEMQKALEAALQWSQGNGDKVNVSRSGGTDMEPVLQVLDSRAPRNILAQDAQKLQNLFLAVFENPSEVDLSAPNAFDVWYSKINRSGIPEVQLHCERIPAAAMQSGDLSQQSVLTAPAKLGFVDSVERAEGLMWSATGKAALACVVAGAGVAVAAISGGALLPLAATAFSVSGMGFTATAVGSAATTALSAGAGVVSAGIEVVQAVGGLFNRQHEMAHAR